MIQSDAMLDKSGSTQQQQKTEMANIRGETCHCLQIENLPEEILERIMSYLSPYNDCKNASLVSRKWQKQCELIIHWWCSTVNNSRVLELEIKLSACSHQYTLAYSTYFISLELLAWCMFPSILSIQTVLRGISIHTFSSPELLLLNIFSSQPIYQQWYLALFTG